MNHNERKIFKNVSNTDWNDWRWQLRNRLLSVDDLKKVFNPKEEVIIGAQKATEKFRMAITPYYANLVDIENPYCPVFLQSVPQSEESFTVESDLLDPLEEERDSPVPGLTHRYPDRVLLLITDICSMYCRHCTRRRLVGFDDKNAKQSDLEKAMEYIRQHEEIRDVIVSGGDPLTLSEEALEPILKQLREIKHVEIIRLGTRTPVVLPQRITDELIVMLKKYQPIYINTHFNHYKEVTLESSAACMKLADGGFPLANQTVLLRGINDCPTIIKKLNHELLKIRVRPYYLFQCDMSEGISHFRTSLGKGIEIIESLRGHTSGLAIPTYVVDLSGGGGKVPLMPTYLISQSDDKAVLRNFEGAISVYDQPHRWDSVCDHNPKSCIEKNRATKGPAYLLSHPDSVLEPKKRKLTHFKPK